MQNSIFRNSWVLSLLYQLAECSFKLYGWKLSWSLEGRGGMVVYCMLVSHIYCRTMYFIMEFQLNYRSTVNYLQLLPRHENSKISINTFGMFLYRKTLKSGTKLYFNWTVKINQFKKTHKTSKKFSRKEKKTSVDNNVSKNLLNLTKEMLHTFLFFFSISSLFMYDSGNILIKWTKIHLVSSLLHL